MLGGRRQRHLSLGFDSYKLDGCGAQRDIALWAELFNHSIEVRRAARPDETIAGMMLENCHDDDGRHLGPGGTGGNAPYYTEAGQLWCPFHTYRTSGDARPTYGSLLGNLNSTRAAAARNLSLPGCWAYADMMEVGVTAMQEMHDCGPSGAEPCGPLTVSEARNHFGGWAIVSSPLVLGFDLRNATMLDLHWDTITNTDAIAVNQDWAGHSGTLFAQSAANTTFHACDWRAGVTCQWPSWTSWYKPLSGGDARGSTMAVLLMNNGDAAAALGFAWRQVPGLHHVAEGCEVYDVWRRRPLGRASGGRFDTAAAVPSRDSAFLTLSGCR